LDICDFRLVERGWLLFVGKVMMCDRKSTIGNFEPDL